LPSFYSHISLLMTSSKRHRLPGTSMNCQSVFHFIKLCMRTFKLMAVLLWAHTNFICS